MSQATVMVLDPRNHTAAALPADLHHVAIFRQDRHGALAAGNARSCERELRVGFDVVFDVFMAFPFQPLAHFLRCRGSFWFRTVRNLGTAQRLQSFANHVIGGRLHFLNARDVIGADDQRKVSQAAPQNLAAVIAEQRHGEQSALCELLRAPG